MILFLCVNQRLIRNFLTIMWAFGSFSGKNKGTAVFSRNGGFIDYDYVNNKSWNWNCLNIIQLHTKTCFFPLHFQSWNVMFSSDFENIPRPRANSFFSQKTVLFEEPVFLKSLLKITTHHWNWKLQHIWQKGLIRCLISCQYTNRSS